MSISCYSMYLVTTIVVHQQFVLQTHFLLLPCSSVCVLPTLAQQAKHALQQGLKFEPSTAGS